MADRGLTPGEIQMAQKVFGNSIDYSKVVIHSNSTFLGFSETKLGNHPHAPDGTIYYPDKVMAYYADDFSLSFNETAYSTFIHEMVHVWQYQNKVIPILDAGMMAITGNYVYDYSSLVFSQQNQKTFYQLNIEQQAAFLQDYYLLLRGVPLEYPNLPDGAPTLQDYRDRLPASLVAAVDELPEAAPTRPGSPRQAHCFAAGTIIDMADGSKKKIEEIKAGDEVLSYREHAFFSDKRLYSGQVTRIFKNIAPEVINFHGTFVTPDHVTLCGDGDAAGQHLPLIDIIRLDACVVGRDGRLIRATTNCEADSPGDQFVYCIAAERSLYTGELFVRESGYRRSGLKIMNQKSSIITSILNIIRSENGVLLDSGLINYPGITHSIPFIFLSPALPRSDSNILYESTALASGQYAKQN